MGEGRGYICEKCGYQFKASWGNGFLFPMLYAEIKEKMLSGELGMEAKAFLEEYPDGAFDAERTLAQCNECGQYETVIDLTMYTPKKGYIKKINPDQIWSTAAPFRGADYVSWYDLRKNYTEFKKYPHECSKCKGQMRLIPLHIYNVEAKTFIETQKMNEEVEHLKCPICGEVMSICSFCNWD